MKETIKVEKRKRKWEQGTDIIKEYCVHAWKYQDETHFTVR